MNRAILLGRHALLAAALFVPGTAEAQSTTEIIRGRIFTADSVPLEQAEVLVTGLATRISLTARTDAKGSYTVLFSQAEGDYIVAVRKIGFLSTSFRLTRTGLSSVLGSDTYLKPNVMVLDTVSVNALGQTGANRTAVGEMSSVELADAMFLSDPAKLMDLLLSMPFIYVTDSGFSVMGAGSDQNAFTIDGARGGKMTLPPDAFSSVKLVTSTADPARGGNAGGTIAGNLRGGTDIFAATVRTNTSNRSMVWNDAAYPNPVPRLYNTSGFAGGPLNRSKSIKYNVSWNANDRLTDWYSLLEPRPSILAQRGIRMDTITAVTNALSSLGIPLSYAGLPRNSEFRGASMSTVLDFTPTATSSLRLSGSTNFNSSQGGQGGATSFPTSAADNWSRGLQGQIRHSGYLKGLLNEANFSFYRFQDNQDPFSPLPAANVRVGTVFDDGRTGFSTIGFGGGQGSYFSTEHTYSFSDELSWLPKSGAHKFKIGGSAEYFDSKFFYYPNDPLTGRYTYLSVADLVANQPASYERLINTTARNTANINQSAWIGDEWVVNKAWQLQGGLRLDNNFSITTPVYNPAADSTFGIKTDRIPRGVGVTPRLGFSWSSPKRRGRSSGGSSTLGGMSAGQLNAMPPELVMSMLNVQRNSTLPGIGVSGTIGGFRGSVDGGQIADVVESTGLNSRILLSCVGSEVPIPDWTTITAGPTTCAGGGSGSASTFSLARPLVRVFDPSYQPLTAWRATFGVDGMRLPNTWIVSVNASTAYNTHGQSSIDLNLNPTPSFTMAAEGGRPVYVPVGAIVPATGTASPGASRVSPEFGVVTNRISDLRQFTSQIQVSVAPPRPIINNKVNLQLSYGISGGAGESRGNTRGGITGSPFEKVWVRSATPLHNFRVNASARVWWLNAGISAFLQSGLPFTPTVSGDINGDGNTSNDRAFVPNPATTTDTSLARQMNDLLAVAPAAAKRCLTSQFGQMAGLNNCKLPWQFRVDMNASLTPPSSWGYNDRLRVTMNLQNASGGLVRLLHMENTPLGQSSLSTQVTNQLLYVKGFDPATQQFKYGVNQLFGQPTNFGSLRRRYAPMQLQMGLEYKFGGPVLNPMSRGLGLREQANKPALTDAERRANIAKLRKDPVAPILKKADSLSITAEQRTQLDAISAEFNAKADTATASLEKWAARKGRRIFDDDLAKRLTPAQTALAKLNADYDKKAKAVLTADQRAMLAPAPAPTKPAVGSPAPAAPTKEEKKAAKP